MPIALIDDLHIAPGEIRVRATQSFADAYLRDEFWVRYEVAGGKPDVAEERALIPFLANVAPVVWLAGLDVEVPVLDERFLASLTGLRAAYTQMYPELAWSGSIIADEVRSGTHRDPGGPTVLFSGGVDSVYTSLEVGGVQTLATVRGADIPLDNDLGWEAVRSQTEDFAARRAHTCAFIEANLRNFIDIPTVEAKWFPGKSWWASVQHGPGLLGLVAPISRGAVVIAATHSTVSAKAHGSTPSLDSALAWGDATVEHHGFKAPRQEKVAAIVAAGPTNLRVCFKDAYGTVQNCGKCEKCLRTIAAIVASGGDARQFGFALSPAGVFAVLRRRLRWYQPPLAELEAWRWRAIQSALTVAEERSLPRSDDLDWFTSFDFDTYERRWAGVLGVRVRLIRLMRRVPGLERTLKRLRSRRLSRSSAGKG